MVTEWIVNHYFILKVVNTKFTCHSALNIVIRTLEARKIAKRTCYDGLRRDFNLLHFQLCFW